MSAAPTSTLIAAGLPDLAARNPATPGGASPHRTYDGEGFRVRDISFDAGGVLAEHATPDPIVVVTLRGTVRFRVGETTHVMPAGAVLHVAAGQRHEVTADEPAHLLVTLLG